MLEELSPAFRRCMCASPCPGRLQSGARWWWPTWGSTQSPPPRTDAPPSSSARSCASVAKPCPPTRSPSRSTSCRPCPSRRPANWCVTMRNVVVTGGSRGLGLGIARRLTGAGYCTIAIARKESHQLTLAMEAAGRDGPGALHFIPFDLAEIADIPRLVKTLRTDFGPIHGLVNNAAVGADGALALMHTSQIEQLVRMNTLSPIVLTKYVVRAMMADGGGRIVNVASILRFTGFSRLSVYG